MSWVVGDKLERCGLGLCGTSAVLMWPVLADGHFVQGYPVYGFPVRLKSLILTAQ